MARRREIVPSPGVAMRDAWDAIGAIDGTGGGAIQDGPRDPERRRSERTWCPCRCSCGAYGVNGSKCHLCTQGVHHRCSRACRAFDPVLVTYHGVTAQTNYIPARQACNGGQDGSGAAKKGPRRD